MLKGFRSVTVASTFLLAVLSSEDVQNIISAYPKEFGSAVAIVIVILRIMTTTPIFGITSVSVEDAEPAPVEQKYPRLDPKPYDQGR